MNQRTLATVLATPLVVGLAVVALREPLPYTTYSPGPTIDVLAAPDGKEIIQVNGQKTYRDTGQLRMTTVSVTPQDAELNLFDVMAAWLDRSDAVYPRSAVYEEGKTAEQAEVEGQVQMVSAQDTAAAVALHALGYDVPSRLEVQQVEAGTPADGNLEVRDLFVAVNGTALPASGDLQQAAHTITDAIAAVPAGSPVDLTVLRDGKEVTVPVTPEPGDDGQPRIGIVFGEGFVLPFPVTVTIDPRIGGPSAGLMFSLAIYDTLTPGSLTGGGEVAGTGEIASNGEVGPIGGIQQKIAGARAAGAQLFLVPADNCGDAAGAHRGDMRLAKVATFDEAEHAVETWAADHDATLPGCDD